MPTFSDVVDAADQLSPDEQQTLVELLRRRIADRNRKRLAQDVQEARGEFAKGQSKPTSAGDIIREAQP